MKYTMIWDEVIRGHCIVELWWDGTFWRWRGSTNNGRLYNNGSGTANLQTMKRHLRDVFFPPRYTRFLHDIPTASPVAE